MNDFVPIPLLLQPKFNFPNLSESSSHFKIKLLQIVKKKGINIPKTLPAILVYIIKQTRHKSYGMSRICVPVAGRSSSILFLPFCRGHWWSHAISFVNTLCYGFFFSLWLPFFHDGREELSGTWRERGDAERTAAGAIKWVPASVATLMMVVHTSLNSVFFLHTVTKGLTFIPPIILLLLRSSPLI